MKRCLQMSRKKNGILGNYKGLIRQGPMDINMNYFSIISTTNINVCNVESNLFNDGYNRRYL